MASCYWIDTTGLAAWDDGVVGVATPWASTSGGNDNVAKPADGDSAYFTSPGITAPTSNPGAAVTLARLDMGMTSALDLSATVASNVAIAAAGALILAGATVWPGLLGVGASAVFQDTSSTSAAAIFSGTNNVTFSVGATNNCTTFSGTGNALIFSGGATNAATFSVTGTVSIGLAVNTGAITATSATLNDVLSGAGSLIANTAISGSGDNQSIIVGTVTITGVSAISSNQITGNCTLASGGKNTGTVTGTLTAPYSLAAGAWGSWGALVITGLPSGGARGPIVLD